jgi:hypothetical protein
MTSITGQENAEHQIVEMMVKIFLNQERAPYYVLLDVLFDSLSRDTIMKHLHLLPSMMGYTRCSAREHRIWTRKILDKGVPPECFFAVFDPTVVPWEYARFCTRSRESLITMNALHVVEALLVNKDWSAPSEALYSCASEFMFKLLKPRVQKFKVTQFFASEIEYKLQFLARQPYDLSFMTEEMYKVISMHPKRNGDVYAEVLHSNDTMALVLLRLGVPFATMITQSYNFDETIMRNTTMGVIPAALEMSLRNYDGNGLVGMGLFIEAVAPSIPPEIWLQLALVVTSFSVEFPGAVSLLKPFAYTPEFVNSLKLGERVRCGEISIHSLLLLTVLLKRKKVCLSHADFVQLGRAYEEHEDVRRIEFWEIVCHASVMKGNQIVHALPSRYKSTQIHSLLIKGVLNNRLGEDIFRQFPEVLLPQAIEQPYMLGSLNRSLKDGLRFLTSLVNVRMKTDDMKTPVKVQKASTTFLDIYSLKDLRWEISQFLQPGIFMAYLIVRAEFAMTLKTHEQFCRFVGFEPLFL